MLPHSLCSIQSDSHHLNLDLLFALEDAISMREKSAGSLFLESNTLPGSSVPCLEAFVSRQF